MRTVALPITSLPANAFAVAGDHVDFFGPGVSFDVSQSTGNDGTYTVFLAAYSSALGTVITVNETVPDATVDGYVLQEGFGNLFTHLEGSSLTVATLVRMTRRDGTVLGFTDHDTDLVWDGDTFYASGGYVPTSIQTTATLSVDNLMIEGPFTTTLPKADLIAGLYDKCTIEVMLVNYADLTMGAMVLQAGEIGEVTLMDYQFKAEFRSKIDKLQAQVGEVTTPDCRAALGDSRCGITLAEWTETGDVSAVTDDKTFAATIDAPYVAVMNTHADNADIRASGWFDGGRLTWTSGDNNGLSMEVYAQTYAAGSFSFTLFLDMPYDIGVGDTFSVYPGCPKLISTCISKFDNVLNFRGEPFVPGETHGGDYGVI